MRLKQIQGDCATTGWFRDGNPRTGSWSSVGQVKVTARTNDPTGVAVQFCIRVTISFRQLYRKKTRLYRKITQSDWTSLSSANVHTLWVVLTLFVNYLSRFLAGATLPHLAGHRGASAGNKRLANGKARVCYWQRQRRQTLKHFQF